MRFKILHIIFFVIVFLTQYENCFSQNTTINLILNNSFEYRNSSAEDYVQHNGQIDDTVIVESTISCWGNASRFFGGMYIDTFWCCGPKSTQDGITHLEVADQVTSSGGQQYYTNVAGRTGNGVVTKLSHTLSAGEQYVISGYINALIDSFLPNVDYTGGAYYHAYNFYTHLANVGFLFSSNQTYTGNTQLGMFALTPSLILHIPPFPNRQNNDWRYFEMIYTATGGEQYLTIANFDSLVTNFTHYTDFDSIAVHENLAVNPAIYDYHNTLGFDNLTLIPLSDTGKTVINLHISDPDSILMQPQVVTCNGEAVALQTGAEFGSYIWSTGDTSAQINVTTAGVYKLTVSNGCGLYVDSVEVVSVPPVTVPLVLSASQTEICIGSENSTLTATSSFPYRQWNTGDTSTNITVSQTGIYICIASNGCVSDTASITISENPCCGNFGSSIFDTICSGDSYFFNGQHSASGTYKDTLQTAQGCDSIVTLLLTVNPPLQESFSGSFYSNSYYLFNGIELTESGVYKDTLQNAQGCDSIITLTLSMVLAPDTPFISITASQNSVEENAGTITLTAHLSQVTANVVTADLELTGTATLNEDYTVSGTSFHFPAGALTDSVSLTIIDDPYYEGNETIFAGLDVIHNALLGQPATATITIIDNENSSDPPPPPPILPTAIEEVNVLEAIKIYPVPAQDFVKIVMSADIPQIATLVDIQGRIVTEITIVSGENTIDLSGISSGTYVFRFTNKQYNYFTGAKPITVVR